MNKISLIQSQHRKELETLHSEMIRARQEQKEGLEHLHGLSRHPKADDLYQIAWDLGHSYGFSEVKYYYDILVKLVK